jgi:hypothetical protein
MLYGLNYNAAAQKKKKHNKGKRHSSVSSSGSRKVAKTPSVASAAHSATAEPAFEMKSEECKYIPRLLDEPSAEAPPENVESRMDPITWSVEDVSLFLRINDCQPLIEHFVENVRRNYSQNVSSIQH